MAVVRRAFVANDQADLYLRVQNWKGTLPGFRQPPLWAITIYMSGDPAVPTSAKGVYGARLRLPATYLAARWSDSERFAAFEVQPSPAGGWVFSHHITSAAAPRWEPSSGTVEAVIPIPELASGRGAIPGAYAHLQAGFAVQDLDTGAWYDGDFMEIHHRLAFEEEPQLDVPLGAEGSPDAGGGQAVAPADPDPLLEGENPDSLSLEYAAYWTQVYATLLEGLMRAAAADPAERIALRAQGERFERRLAFWRARSSEIVDRYP